jgi:hypothetical protein
LGRISNVCTAVVKTDYVGHYDVREQLKSCNEGVWERGDRTPRTLNLGSRCRQVGSFRPGNFMEYKTGRDLEPLWTFWRIRCPLATLTELPWPLNVVGKLTVK